MTNKPEPNTRAGEALAADNFKRTGEWPDTTSEMLETVLFDTIWRTIKTWDVNVPHAYSGYMGATGNHVRAIYDAVAPLLTRPLPQPSEFGTAWQSAVEETDMLERELDLTNVDHVALWLEANAISPPLTHQLGWVACRITEAYEAQIAKLQADGEKLAGALEQLIKHTTWLESVAPPMCIDGKYMGESLSLADACQALTEWKDRA